MDAIPRTAELLFIGAIRDQQLNGGNLCLFQNDITPSALSVKADFVLANFPGYGNAGNQQFGQAFTTLDSRVRVEAPSHQWDCANSDQPNFIYGWFFVSPTGNLTMARRFDDGPYPMSSDSHSIITAGQLTLPAAA